MEIKYTQQGDYLLPNLMLPEQDNRPIGLWGQQHLCYIKRSRPILYTNLLTKYRLNEYLADIDEQAQKMYDELRNNIRHNDKASPSKHIKGSCRRWRKGFNINKSCNSRQNAKADRKIQGGIS